MSAHEVLTQHILPSWLSLRDPLHGGFYGQVLGDETVVPDAPRGAILYARILWAFSASYRELGNPACLEAADAARHFIERYMQNPESKAAYWSVEADGRPLDTTVHTVVQAYMLYAYSEYVRATHDAAAMQTALTLYRFIETHKADCDEDTCLHIMEAYTNFYRVLPDETVKNAVRALIDRFATQPHAHFNPGHCIECAWLLDEAAEVAGVRCDALVRQLMEEAEQGFNADGTLDDREWWKQAEAVMGYCHLYLRNQDTAALDRARALWQLIVSRYVDAEHGEWYWLLRPDGTPDKTKDKVSFWKCPYHNARLCLYLTVNRIAL